MTIILSTALVVSLYFNYRFRVQIKDIIKTHLLELTAYETAVSNLQSKVNFYNDLYSEPCKSEPQVCDSVEQVKPKTKRSKK